LNPTLTPTTSPTSTPAPTATTAPTPTPKYGIDMEKFHKYPQSYEYLRAHLDEFVQSPNPVSDRAAFDKWFAEQLVPALGPQSERPINIINLGGAGGRNAWEVGPGGGKISSTPPFFWFENEGVVYPVPCITAENPKQAPGTQLTICPALFDSPALFTQGTVALEALINGGRIGLIEVIYDPMAYRGDLDWGEAQDLVSSVGDYTLGMGDERANELGIGFQAVKFGFGSIMVRPPQ
jgi:hypothetical protein